MSPPQARSRRGSSFARRKNSLTMWFALPSPSGVPSRIRRPIRLSVASTHDSTSTKAAGCPITAAVLVFSPLRQVRACAREALLLRPRDPVARERAQRRRFAITQRPRRQRASCVAAAHGMCASTLESGIALIHASRSPEDGVSRSQSPASGADCRTMRETDSQGQRSCR